MDCDKHETRMGTTQKAILEVCNRMVNDKKRTYAMVLKVLGLEITQANLGGLCKRIMYYRDKGLTSFRVTHTSVHNVFCSSTPLGRRADVEPGPEELAMIEAEKAKIKDEHFRAKRLCDGKPKEKIGRILSVGPLRFRPGVSSERELG